MPTLCADMSGFASQGAVAEAVDGTAYMCSLFKLLQATEKTTSQNGLDDIDGLLGCGIFMFKRDYLEVQTNGQVTGALTNIGDILTPYS